MKALNCSARGEWLSAFLFVLPHTLHCRELAVQKHRMMDAKQQLAADLVAYMTAKGYAVDRGRGEINIIYLEGADENGRPNDDRPDEWNDRSLVLEFDEAGQPRIMLNVECTTEPGRAATLSTAAKRRKGVARIAIGQWRAWSVGWHKKAAHPALVQVRNLTVCRDLNHDFKRTGDRVESGLFGINQHGTSPEYRGGPVARYSEGCLVRRWWVDHLAFMALVTEDVRYRVNKYFVFTSTIIDGDDFGRFVDERRKSEADA